MRTPAKIATFTLAAVMLVGLAAPAGAKQARIDVRGAEVGSYVLDDAGAAVATGSVTGEPMDGSYTARLAADDGSLPEPGACETATATLFVTGDRDRFFQLSATGDVCGKWVQDPYVVMHVFTGRYDVVDASKRNLQGTDGWMSVILATEGRANVEAIDT